jgi:DNA-binding transcriptional LysR family regulator
LKDLVTEPWVLGAVGGEARHVLEQAFVRGRFHPTEPILECRPHFLTTQFVHKTPFVTVASRADALTAEKAGLVRILPLPTVLEFGPIGFICRKSSSDDTWLTRFCEETLASIKLGRRRA